MPKQSWSNIATVSVLIVVATIEAAQQAISQSPDLSRVLPYWATSTNWNYVPLILLSLAGVFWLIGHFPQRHMQSHQTASITNTWIEPKTVPAVFVPRPEIKPAPKATPIPPAPKLVTNVPDGAPSDDDLAKIYRITKNGTLTLAFQSDRQNKNDDALFVLLYGYKCQFGIDDVPASDLSRSLWESGCRKELTPLERLIGAATVFFDTHIDVTQLAEPHVANGTLRKHGLSKGGFYALTDTGLAIAKEAFTYVARYAD